MSTVAALLFAFSLLVLSLGMMSPRLVIRWGRNRTRGQVLIVSGLGVLISLHLQTAHADPSMLGAISFDLVLALLGLAAGLVKPDLAVWWGRKKTRHLVLMAYGPATLLFISLYMYVGDTDGGRWYTAKGRDTIVAYEECLRDRPDGRFTAQARAQLEALYQDEGDWTAARAKDTLSYYRIYMVRHPDGKFVEQASRSVEDVYRATCLSLNGPAPQRTQSNVGDYRTGTIWLVAAESGKPDSEARHVESSICAAEWWNASTLVCLKKSEVAVGTYTDGRKGYRHVWVARLVDLATGQVTGMRTFRGSDPPGSKSGGGDRWGDTPSNEFRGWLNHLPVRSVADPRLPYR